MPPLGISLHPGLQQRPLQVPICTPPIQKQKHMPEARQPTVMAWENRLTSKLIIAGWLLQKKTTCLVNWVDL